ncbi:MAG TPA: hypothetical protein VK828_19450 [Terriglobales bacterium]|jgi:photosystem II stability/assembly factor-like uncharacterized protein|nr:hypothetical protein [Terriglobales bacterium]
MNIQRGVALHRLGLSVRRRVVAFFFIFLVAGAAVGQVPTELFNELKWRLIGPFRGGRAAAVAGVPGNSTTFYFGGVNGGVWKTTDAGTVWIPIFDGQPVGSIGAIAVAPSDPRTIYVGTGESDIRSNLASGIGVYKSVDGGATWTHVGLEDTRQISRIVVDPRDANVVYVGALGHAYGPNAERGVYKSVDGGAHWDKVLDAGSEIGISDLAICAGNPQVLFAGTWHTHRPPWSTYAPIDGPGGGLFRSMDGGKSWAQLNSTQLNSTQLKGNGLPDGDWGRIGVDVAPDGKRVYALIEAKKAGLYRSDDGGDSWTLENTDSRLTSRAWYFNGITIDPNNADVFYVPNVALYRSEDGGKTISIVRGAPGGDDYHQIWVDPKNSASMVLGTDQGTSVSLDRGRTWSTWYNQPTAQLYHVITDNQFPYVVYGAQQDSGSAAVLSRTDHGQITPRDWFPAGGSESGYMVPDPRDPNIIYLSETYGGVSRFNKKTGFSQNVSPWPMPTFGTEINLHKYRDPWTPVLVLSPADKTTLYLGTQYVMKTVDGGLHWQTISSDLTGAAASGKTDGPVTVENAKERGYGVVFTIAPSKLNRNLIWAGSDTGLIHVTRDGGKSWKDVTPRGLTAWSKLSMIEASRFDAAVAYAAVDRSRLDDQTPYLYRTRDYGATWQAITEGITGHAFLRAIREDTEKKGLLFAGTETGVYVSFDDGDHWQSLQLNLPVSSMRDLTIHGDDLVVATHGRSFWILDNIAPLRQAAEARKADGFWLYHPATAVRVDNDFFSGTPLPPEEPTAENPPSGAMIDYFLKSAAEKITLEIFDGQRKLVSKFSLHVKSDAKPATKQPLLPIADRWLPKPEGLEKAPGMHRFVWNLAWGNAEVNADEDYENRNPSGPKVVPGSYEVRLTVDGRAQNQMLKVVMDPRSRATPAVLQRQLELGLQMFAEARAARRALGEIGSVRKGLTGVQQKIGGENAALSSEVTETLAEISQIVSNKGSAAWDPGGLQAAFTGLASALRTVESGDREVPAQAIDVYRASSERAKVGIAAWEKFKQTKLRELNRKLEEGNVEPVKVSEIEWDVQAE